MPTLVSPGVAVSVVDESFYGSAGGGTVPLIILATASNKVHPSGLGTAEGTISSGLRLVTSQRDLIQAYGDPRFYSASGTQLHGLAINEYGLLAAHSYLGTANRAYVLRADIDTDQLRGSSATPTGPAADGTFWIDSAETSYGIYEWDTATSKWVPASTVHTDLVAGIDEDAGIPKPSFGQVGDFAVVQFNGTGYLGIYKKLIPSDGNWVLVGQTVSNDFQVGTHLTIPTLNSVGAALTQDDIFLKSTRYNGGTQLTVRQYDDASSSWDNIAVEIVDTPARLSAPVLGTVIAEYDTTGKLFFKQKQTETSVATATALYISLPGTTPDPISLSLIRPVTGEAFLQTGINTNAEQGAAELSSLLLGTVGFESIVASVFEGKLVLTDTLGLPFEVLVCNSGIAPGIYSAWNDIATLEQAATPTGRPLDGTLWFDTNISKFDLLVSDGTNWVDHTDGMFVSSARPTAPATNDLWLDTADIDNYPAIHRYDGVEWNQLDNTDQTSTDGILFADIRSSVSIHTDAPSAALYPVGMLAWNMRASGYNVKRFVRDYAPAGGDTWVTESGLQSSGTMYSGSEAVKKVIVQSMASVMASTDDLRSETVDFTLIAAPGFPELIDEMVTLNVDRKETAFVVADTPFTLKAKGTDIQRWGSNADNATGNGKDGLTTNSPYVGVYYPSGLATNTNGAEVVVPASHMALRTISYNDTVAYPWFAPAGSNRGLISNASSVGYLDENSEYVPVSLNEGLRDVLYSQRINPMTFMPGVGLVVYGQKTLNPGASAMDRVNVARLVNYLRDRFEAMSKPFLFEPNDQRTRDNVITMFNNFMGDIASKRGLYDFLVVCDTTNNTPARIDRNELWIDVAIQPMKAVEFIYIPVRIKNTGEAMI